MTRERWYREVSIDRITEAGKDGYRILLDGTPLRSPAGTPVVLPNAKLADAIAAEWRAQEAKINPATMVLTKLVNTAIDRVAPNRLQAIEQISAYGNSDLLCYRADSPAEL